MKTIFNYTFLLLLWLLMACQKEELEIINESNPETLSVTSPLTSLITRVTQNPTASDNILDNSSCFKVQLPVTVIVNTKNITVNTQADYVLVKNAIDAFSNDDDLVNFVYPFTIQFQNFQTQIVHTPKELETVIENCTGEDSDEIDCIRFVYPLVINLYNSGNQTPTVLTFNNNPTFFNFFKSLKNNDLLAIKFPIQLINTDGQTITITSHTDLKNLIELALNDCHNQHGGGGNTNADFNVVLTSGAWKITLLQHPNEITLNYSDYTFNFLSGGVVKATKSAQITTGNWSAVFDKDALKINLNFDGDALKLIEENWQMIVFTNTTIRLKNSGSSNTVNYLYFTKIN
ncbi:hypothetical protein [Flavobacterium sp.]|uniref:hypothetical protein n=1 Tax=Flavobacterium sp. TaxID=239 RepID=UPI003D0DA7E3